EVGQEGGAHSNFPPFDSSNFPSQLVWFAIAFAFLYWFMSKRALPQLGAVIEERRARIARDLDDATAMQQRADAAAAAPEKTLAGAGGRAVGGAGAAGDRPGAESATRRRDRGDDLAARLPAADREFAAARTQAMTNAPATARGGAGAIAGRRGGRPADPAAVA